MVVVESVMRSDGWVGRLPVQRRHWRMPEKHLEVEFCDLVMSERERTDSVKGKLCFERESSKGG